MMKRISVLSIVALMLLAGTVATAPFYPDKLRLLVYRDSNHEEHDVRTADDWAIRRAHILENMQEVMGPLPSPKEKEPLDIKIHEEVRLGNVVRKKISFAPEDKDRVPAYLFIPLNAKCKLPAMLCLHQTTRIGKGEPAGLGGLPNLHYALHLAERGYVTFAPDYPNFGEYTFDPYKNGYQSGSMKAVWNNMRAIDLLQGLPEVDPQRIGCIGHSLGGHNTLFTAAFDTRIKALVSSCGFTRFPKYYGGNLKGWTSATYMPRIAQVFESKPEKMPFDFTEVSAALAPRAFFASAPVRDDNFEVSGVRDVLGAALPVYELLGAKEKLTAIYPNCAHDFPLEARAKAYEWLDRWLK